jgi:hypothetical protein
MSNAQIETITPDMAKAYLANNNNNRNITKTHIAFLKSEILSGNYKMNGQSIVLGSTGRLLDGQHRLTAVVETGIPIQSIVVHNVDEATFVTMDTGKARGGCDALDIYGATNSKHMASAIRKVLQKFSNTHNYLDGVRHKISNPEFVKYYKQHTDELDDLYEMTHAWILKGNKLLSESDSMAFIILLREESNDAYDFIEEIITGEKINKTSNAAQICRKKLIDTRVSGMNVRETQKRDWVIYSFRKYIKNINMKKMSIRDSQSFAKVTKSFFERLVA